MMRKKIIIVEGIDRVGKTTLCKMLEKKGFLYIKDKFHLAKLANLYKETAVIDREYNAHMDLFESYSAGKIDTTIVMLELLSQKFNIVVDRLHLTEIVYGGIERTASLTTFEEADDALRALDVTLLIVTPNDIERSNREAHKDLTQYNSDFLYFFSHSKIKNKIRCNYDTLSDTVDTILELTYDYDFYFASPFFSDEQVEREEALIAKLRSEGYTVFSPKESCFLARNASLECQEAVFKNNCYAIDAAKAVFAVTDGRDMGTIWEAGYAYGTEKPIIYFAETLKGPFNLMLAQSGQAALTSRDQVTREVIDPILLGERQFYKGDIE